MELMQLGTVPIINDNYAITSRAMPVFDDESNEVLWDNDVLASRIAVNLRADLLVMVTANTARNAWRMAANLLPCRAARAARAARRA